MTIISHQFIIHLALMILSGACLLSSMTVNAATDDQKLTETKSIKAKELIKQSDQIRPDEQYETQFFGRPLTIGGEIGIDLQRKNDFELEDDKKDDEVSLEGKIELELFFQLSSRISILLEPIAIYESELYAENDNLDADSYFRRGQSWIYIDGFSNKHVALQVGRQTFQDKREWWWGSELDAVRLHYNRKRIDWELALAKEMAKIQSNEPNIDPEKQDIYRVLGAVSWNKKKKNTMSAFFTFHNDRSNDFVKDQIINENIEDDSDAKLIWFGLRTMGKNKIKKLGKISYWIDLAHLEGTETYIDFDNNSESTSIVDKIFQNEISGSAYDIGITLETKFSGKPSLTIGYAKGSGSGAVEGEIKKRTDTSFRQTGLEDNKGKYSGVNRFRYYGELLRPELSNLTISTIALGLSHDKNRSTEIIYHRYQQVKEADFLRGNSLKDKPNGKNKNIGEEIDVVFGIEKDSHWEWELVASIFKAGSAFGENVNEVATKFSLGVDYNF